MLTVAILTPAEVEILRLAASGVTLDTIHQEIRTMTQTITDQIAAADSAESALVARVSDLQAQITAKVSQLAQDDAALAASNTDRDALSAEVVKLTQQLSGIASAPTPAPVAPAPPADVAPPAPAQPSAPVGTNSSTTTTA